MAVLLRLLGFLAPYRRRIFFGLFLLFIDVALELAPGLVWLRIVDGVILKREVGLLLPLVGLLVGINLAEATVSRGRRLTIEPVAQGLVRDLREAMMSHLSQLPIAYYGDSQTGDLLSRVGNDVDAVQEVVINGTDSLIANALRLVGVVVIFVSLNPLLGVATTLPILLVGGMILTFNRRVRPLYTAARKQLGSLNARLADTLSGIRVVKGFAREGEERTALAILNDAFMATQLKAVRARADSFPWVGFVASFGNVIMVGLGAWLILQGRFTLGGLIAYRNYGRYFYGPIDNLAGINDMLQRAIAAGTRIFEVLDAPTTISDAKDAIVLPPVQGRLTFRNVSFEYGGDLVLDEVDFTIEPGQRVAVVGESGAGKSTLFALATRFYDPVKGSILIDGHDLRSLTQHSLRRQIVSVQQDTFLFAATVAENIGYGHPEATLEEIESAARAANAWDFIQRLPSGLDTYVGERGGEAQRRSAATDCDRPRLLSGRSNPFAGRGHFGDRTRVGETRLRVSPEASSEGAPRLSRPIGSRRFKAPT